jgi:hypothetical protein
VWLQYGHRLAEDVVERHGGSSTYGVAPRCASPAAYYIPDGTVTVTVWTYKEAWKQYARSNAEASVRHDGALLHGQRCALTPH